MAIGWLKNMLGMESAENAAPTLGAEIIDTTDGILTLKVSGKVKYAELAAVRSLAGQQIQKLGKVKILVLADGFEGWEGKGEWSNSSFSEKYDSQIEKMAIVGDKKWEGETLMFVSKGFRPVAIEYFETGQEDRARIWLKQPVPPKAA